ncbi:hypothetical protein [Demequina sp. NBRC 110053]|uniref:hypothetical protein n=1 Tax=Demequina sp. NBRC 110053 TaxID=1570342 RepID=UPI0011871083|nr:hypothetical protein [Demequina sp. NBRC 110053]
MTARVHRELDLSRSRQETVDMEGAGPREHRASCPRQRGIRSGGERGLVLARHVGIGQQPHDVAVLDGRSHLAL